VGNVGSVDRMSYTAIGDSVEFAWKLKQLNHLYGTRIIVSEPVYSVVAGQFRFRHLDDIPLHDVSESLAIDKMNARFASVAANMARMDHTVAAMNGHVGSLPVIVANVDRIQGTVAEMDADTDTMGDTMISIDEGIADMTLYVGDMRGSFAIMEQTVGRMNQE
jgi:hypothetical protein